MKIKITDERITNDSEVIYVGRTLDEIKSRLEKDLKEINFELPNDFEFEIIDECDSLNDH